MQQKVKHLHKAQYTSETPPSEVREHQQHVFLVQGYIHPSVLSVSVVGGLHVFLTIVGHVSRNHPPQTTQIWSQIYIRGMWTSLRPLLVNERPCIRCIASSLPWNSKIRISGTPFFTYKCLIF